MRRHAEQRTLILAAAALLLALILSRPLNLLPRLAPGFARPPIDRRLIATPLDPSSYKPYAPEEAATDPAEPTEEPTQSASRRRTGSARLGVLRDAPADPSVHRGPAAQADARHSTRPSAPANPSRAASPRRDHSMTDHTSFAARSKTVPMAPHSTITSAARGGNSFSASARASATPHPPPERTGRKDTGAAASGTRMASGSHRSGRRYSSLFSVAAAGSRRPAAHRAEPAPRRFRPLLLSKLIGPSPLRPPPGNLSAPPALLALSERRPEPPPGQAPPPREPAGLAAAENLDPTELPRDHRVAAHWDEEGWHEGAARGLSRADAWLWLYKEHNRWWALAGRPPSALVRHQRVWWLKERGLWFVVHDGEPWVWRRFHDWDAQGLFHPGTGTQIVYSADFSRVAVVTPGRGAEVFDAASGEELARIPEERMPAKRRPKAPQALVLP